MIRFTPFHSSQTRVVFVNEPSNGRRRLPVNCISFMVNNRYSMTILKWTIVTAITLSLSILSQVQANECVILLHGLARSDSSMLKLASVLDEQGYATVNYGYPSTKHGVKKLAQEAISDALPLCPRGSRVNFVTHSMGGILVRQYLAIQAVENLGRVVMLGPPNKGSQVVDVLKNFPGFEVINGPAGMQLGTESASRPNQLGAAKFDVGIIAGNRSINLILSSILPGADDGKVTVENTKLKGMSDHLTLPVTHPFMMKNDEVIEQVVNYLKEGVFSR